MTARGRDGEPQVVDQLLDEYPSGILSVVADSYNIYGFVNAIGSQFKERIMQRDGVFVVRPDSVTATHPTPESLVVEIVNALWHDFGGTANEKGYKVLDPHVRILWGDGIDPTGIRAILEALALHSFSAENIVFGMGGGLLQKVNRDTQRFAFKASAIKRSGEWHDVFKQPLDHSKDSKKGRLRLIQRRPGEFETVPGLGATAHGSDIHQDQLQTVFEDGKLVSDQTFADIRKRAGHPAS
jgi:nicotinamide phosphoribosyltransferase